MKDVKEGAIKNTPVRRTDNGASTGIIDAPRDPSSSGSQQSTDGMTFSGGEELKGVPPQEDREDAGAAAR
jgi:hypothetical protein